MRANRDGAMREASAQRAFGARQNRVPGHVLRIGRRGGHRAVEGAGLIVDIVDGSRLVQVLMRVDQTGHDQFAGDIDRFHGRCRLTLMHYAGDAAIRPDQQIGTNRWPRRIGLDPTTMQQERLSCHCDFLSKR
jgi:hypothetical protein